MKTTDHGLPLTSQMIAAARTKPLDVLTVPVEPGVTLVEASAGTGKTFALAGLVLRLVLEGRVSDLSRLLVVTFTNAATDELKTRIRRALHEALVAFSGGTPAPDVAPLVAPFLEPYGAEAEDRQRARQRLATALAGADAAAVSTIHGFCQRELERAAFASGTPFSMAFVEDEKPLRARAAADVWHRLAHADPRVARLAVREGWIEGAFLPVFEALGAHPRARLEPEAPPLREALAAVEQAGETIAKALDDAFEERFAAVTWKKKFALCGRAPAEAAAALASAAGDPFGEGARLLRSFTSAALADAAFARSADACDALRAHPAVAACDALDKALAALRFSAARTFAEETAASLDAIKAREGLLTPDDLLRRLYAALEDPTRGAALAQAIAARYDAALIDEFQDTDPYQLAIFQRALDGRPVFLVGDPKQAIYAFRGADLFAYLDARRGAARRYALDTNWRSSSGLVEAVNALFAQPTRPFVYDDIPYEPVAPSPSADAEPLTGDDRGALVWWTFECQLNGRPQPKGRLEPRLVQATVHEIRRLLAGGYRIGQRPLRPGDLAILVRVNAQGEQMQAALRAAGVASVISKGGDIFEARETAEVERVLTALARPHDAAAVRGALATELWGYSAQTIIDLDETPGAWAQLVERLERLGALWRRRGVLRALNQFLADEDVAARLLAYADGERRMTNVRHVAGLLHRAEGAGRRSPDDLLRWLAGRHTRTLADREEAELRLESDADAVQITTIHSAKGLQYGVVFAPFLGMARPPNWTGRNGRLDHPFVHEGEDVVFDLGSERLEARRAAHEAERLAEEIRLTYVALTRAKHRCYVAWGPCNTGEASGLGYLLHGHAAPSAAPAEHVAAAKQRAEREMIEAEAALRDLAAGCPAMCVEPLPDGSSGFAPLVADASDDGALGTARLLPEDARRRLRPRTRASFSAWTRGRAVERPGTDEVVLMPEPVAPSAAMPAGMHAFAAGLQAGLCLHDLLQRVDLRQPEGASTHRLVEQTLTAYGLIAPSRHRAAIDPVEVTLALLDRLAALPLPGSESPSGGPVCLGDLGPRQRLAEWRFVLPLGHTSPAALGDAFAAHAAPQLRGYAEALRDLSPEAAEGLLAGTADLVAEHGGRYWLLDWKTNRLGEDDAAYAPEALAQAMQDNHFVLQYHLYLVGLDAYLRTRLPDYDYDRHIGGVGYAFLRGAGREDFGLYADRPPRALIEALASLLSPAD